MLSVTSSDPEFLSYTDCSFSSPFIGPIFLQPSGFEMASRKLFITLGLICILPLSFHSRTSPFALSTQSSEVSSLNPLLCPNSCTIACLLLDIYISELTVLFLLHIQCVPKPPCPPTQLHLLPRLSSWHHYPFHHFGHPFCFIFYSQSTNSSNSSLELFPLLYVSAIPRKDP